MKTLHIAGFVLSFVIIGCGGNNSPSVQTDRREFSVVMGFPGTDSVTLNGTEYILAFNQHIGPFELAADENFVTYAGDWVEATMNVPIPSGDKEFVIFDSPFPSSGPPEFVFRYAVRAIPKSPASGLLLHAFGPLTPDPATFNAAAPMDFYLLPEGQKPVDGTPFATATTLAEEIPFVKDFPAAAGQWVLWTTRPGKPANTLIKTISFERKDRTSIVLQSSSVSGTIYVDHE